MNRAARMVRLGKEKFAREQDNRAKEELDESKQEVKKLRHPKFDEENVISRQAIEKVKRWLDFSSKPLRDVTLATSNRRINNDAVQPGVYECTNYEPQDVICISSLTHHEAEKLMAISTSVSTQHIITYEEQLDVLLPMITLPRVPMETPPHQLPAPVVSDEHNSPLPLDDMFGDPNYEPQSDDDSDVVPSSVITYLENDENLIELSHEAEKLMAISTSVSTQHLITYEEQLDVLLPMITLPRVPMETPPHQPPAPVVSDEHNSPLPLDDVFGDPNYEPQSDDDSDIVPSSVIEYLENDENSIELPLYDLGLLNELLDKSNISSQSKVPSVPLMEVNQLDKLPGKKKHTRRARPCFYCSKFVKTLTRHLTTVHNKEPDVQAALCLSLKSRNAAFKQMKRDGIMKHNKIMIGIKDPVVEREREVLGQTVSDLIVCGKCTGVFSRKAFYKHKRHCTVPFNDSQPTNIPMTVALVAESIDPTFRSEIASKFIPDEVGLLCSSETTLLMFGQRLYFKLKAKKDKATEVKRSVMTDMRRIGNLFVSFEKECTRLGLVKAPETVQVKDLLSRSKFSALEAAIQRTTEGTETSQMKAGLKIGLYYLLKKLAKIIKSVHLVNRNDDEAVEVDRFVDVLSLNYNYIFGDAIYNINKNREVKLRRPEQLPPDDDVQLVRQFTIDNMSSLLNEFACWTTQEFISLRDLACSRLTMFNARRGGEPARLTRANWYDARDNVWLDSSRLSAMDEKEKDMFQDTKVIYQTGKGNHLVPFLVPKDTQAALEKLCDATTRLDCGISEQNHYLFPSTQNSNEHVYGWHAVNKVCIEAGVKNAGLLTATKMRHKVSTMYACLDIPENQRNYFYKHMGHSSSTNANIYQTPLAEIEIVQVGGVLHSFDERRSCNETITSPDEPHSGRSQSSATSHQVMNVEVETSDQLANSTSRSSYEEGLLKRGSSNGASDKVTSRDIIENDDQPTAASVRSSDRQKSVKRGSSVRASEQIIHIDVQTAGHMANVPTQNYNKRRESLQQGASKSSLENENTNSNKTRRYSKWSEKDTDAVLTYFASWIHNERPGYPGKADISLFMSTHSVSFSDWRIIKVKIVNEKQAYMKRKSDIATDLYTEC